MRQEFRNKCSSVVFGARMLHVSSPDHTLNVVGELRLVVYDGLPKDH